VAKKSIKKSADKKLDELIKTTNDLKNDYKIEIRNLRKSYCIRNLKIFGSSLSLVLPFCIAGSIISTSFYFLGAGLPFKRDEDKKYKKYVYECEDDNIEITEAYNGGNNFDYEYGDTKFEVYSDWVLEDEKYTRTIKSYKEHNLTNMDLFNSVIDKNIEYIDANYVYKSETIEETNNIDLVSKDSGIKIEGIVSCVDKNDYLLVQESDTKNKYITFLVSCFTILIGLIVNRKRNRKVKENIRHYIKEYNSEKNQLSKEKIRIIDNEKRIEALGKWVKKYEKK